MKKIALLTAFALVGLVHAADEKGTVVELDGMKSTTPSTWISEKPINNFRLMQFRLTKAEGDDDDAELVISEGQGGAVKANLERWKGAFVPPEGKKIDDVSKDSKLKVGAFEAVGLQIDGTYKSYATPGDPSSKLTLKPNFKFKGYILETKNKTYYIKFTGPAKTFDKYDKGLTDWLQGFK
jgi:hypothetical protein